MHMIFEKKLTFSSFLGGKFGSQGLPDAARALP